MGGRGERRRCTREGSASAVRQAVDQATCGLLCLSFEGHGSWEDTPLTFPWPCRAKSTPNGEVGEGVIKIFKVF